VRQRNLITKELVVNTSGKDYIVKPIGLAILISCLITLTSAIVSIYLFTLGNPADISFLFPVFMGMGTSIFLNYECANKEGKYGEKQ
jgi:hypothetical protein